LYGPKHSIKWRVGRAIWAFVVNAILWIVVPYYLGILLANRVPETPLATPSFIYQFGVLFIILDVGAAFLDGMSFAVPFLSGAAILSAIYLWLVTNGGALSFHAAGMNVGLEFRLLVYLLVVPSLWSAVKAPISYYIWRRAVLAEERLSRPAPVLSP
jgi:hypothetical protein